jgi:hypothetical protein
MRNQPRRVAETAHWWVDRAADLSAVRLREERREQWHADVSGAAEIGVPRLGLVLGMLLTSAFHRPAHPRPGGSMIRLRATPDPSTRLLVIAALLSVVASSVLGRTLFSVASTPPRVAEGAEFTLGFVVPLVLVLVALSRVTVGRRRGSAAAAMAVAGACSLLVGSVLGGVAWLVAASIGSAGLLAAWFLANRVPPRTWLVIGSPAVALLVVELVVLAARAAFDASMTARPALWAAESVITLMAPLVVAVVVAVAMPLPVTDRRPDALQAAG